MTSPLNEALKQFEATEANLEKLQRLWGQMEKLLPTQSNIRSDERETEQYEDHARHFDTIAALMPKIDGYKLEVSYITIQEAFQNTIDCLDLGEFTATVTSEEHARSQTKHLAEYRFRLRRKRKELARNTVEQLARAIDDLLPVLARD
jgi:hypothetical protein